MIKCKKRDIENIIDTLPEITSVEESAGIFESILELL
jgi:hypothetical protein